DESPAPVLFHSRRTKVRPPFSFTLAGRKSGPRSLSRGGAAALLPARRYRSPARAARVREGSMTPHPSPFAWLDPLPGSVAGDAVPAAALEAVASRSATPLTLEPSDRRFLRAVWIDVAGRTPLPDEWKRVLGRPRREVVAELVASPAGWDGFYEEELFYFLLVDNFRPSTDAFAALPKELAAKRVGVRE